MTTSILKKLRIFFIVILIIFTMSSIIWYLYGFIKNGICEWRYGGLPGSNYKEWDKAQEEFPNITYQEYQDSVSYLCTKGILP